MNHLRNEVGNYELPHRKLQTASTAGKRRPVWAEVVRDMTDELAVGGRDR